MRAWGWYRWRRWCAGGPVQASTAAAPHAAAVAISGGTWGNAEEVPGIATLAEDGSSYPLSLSCGAAGNCSAGGYYTTFVNEPGPQGAFVVSEKSGTWGTAIEVPAPPPSTRAGSPARLGVVSLGGQLQRRRLLHRRLRPPAGVCRRRDKRHLGHRQAKCPAPQPSTRRVRRAQLGVLRLGGQLQRRRLLHRRLRPPAGVRRRRGQTAPGARPRKCPAPPPLTRAGRRAHFGVVCFGGQLQRRRLLSRVLALAGVRRRRDKRHLGHGQAKCPASRPSIGRERRILGQVSCGAAGNCSAGGEYIDGSGHDRRSS